MKRGLSSQKRRRRLIETIGKPIPLMEKVPTKVIQSINYEAIDFGLLKEEGRRILFDVFFKNEKAGYLDFVKKMIPIVLNLHPSFWEDEHFVRWQLIRLNGEYQTSVEKIWRDRWTRAEITEQQQIEQYFFNFLDILPRPHQYDTFLTWGSVSGRQWKDKDGKDRFPIKITELMVKWNVNCPPIPWVFRFIPNGYLREILPKCYRGRPVSNWAEDLTVYELSQAGMKNVEIGRLLFGMDKSRISVGDPKHPILVKIAKIKKAIKKKTTESFPL